MPPAILIPVATISILLAIAASHWSLRRKIAALRGEINGLGGNLGGFRGEIVGLRERMARLEGTTDALLR